jgi:hypothetical protein
MILIKGQRGLSQPPVKRTLLSTVPAYFNDVQRSSTRTRASSQA